MMIVKIEDLQKFILKGLDEFKDTIHKRSFMMTSPGCTKEEINLLKDTIKDIPNSFISLIERYNFNGISIGYFEISPYYNSKNTLTESILKASDDPFFPRSFMEKHGMYQIGSYNTDLLCITKGTPQFKEGEILFVEEGYDIYDPQDSQIKKISKNFEQFLIIAGNLSLIYSEIKDDNSNWEEKKLEFIDRLKQLGIDEIYHKAWLSVF